MSGTGSLIPIHTHANKNILDRLGETADQMLTFDGEQVYKDYDNISIRVMVNELWEELKEAEIVPDTGIIGGGSNNNGSGNLPGGGTIISGDYVTQDVMEGYVQQAMTELVTSAITDDGGDSSDTDES